MHEVQVMKLHMVWAWSLHPTQMLSMYFQVFQNFMSSVWDITLKDFFWNVEASKKLFCLPFYNRKNRNFAKVTCYLTIFFHCHLEQVCSSCSDMSILIYLISCCTMNAKSAFLLAVLRASFTSLYMDPQLSFNMYFKKFSLF